MTRMRRLGVAWICLMAAFLVACYGLIWVADDFGFQAVGDAFMHDDLFGYIGMIALLAPGLLAIGLSAWLARRTS